MTSTTISTPISALPVISEPAPLRYRPGDVVVIVEPRPLVCVVLEEAFNSLIRLSRAACPEAHLVVKVSEVRHLSVWLKSRVTPAAQPVVEIP